MSGSSPAPTWAIVLAFALIYITWGTTYVFIKYGVQEEQLPPLLFAGTRISLAGLILVAWQALRGGSLRLAWRDLASTIGIGWIMFVCGNGLISTAQKTVDSAVAAILVATTPLWIGLFAMFFPRGERLTPMGWAGLLVGLGGVAILFAPAIQRPETLWADAGPFFVLGSAASWALGSLLLRRFKPRADHLTGAAYQMLCGGISLIVAGLALGETHQIPTRITPRAVAVFCYLLCVGSLAGFVAFNWLLGHVSAAQVGTHAYVNPVVAVLIGWLDGEAITPWLLGGIAVILVGVFLVRGCGRPTTPGPALPREEV